MKRLKHSVTVETSVHLELLDLAQQTFGEQFDPNARFEVHVQLANGQRAKIDNLVAVFITQFVREERPPVDEKPSKAAEEVET